jgi:predicted glycogen debranching enzyme
VLHTPDIASMSIDQMMEREWLVSNGIGGYATGTIASVPTRKYHGLLVASLHPPVRRMVVLSRLEETLEVGGLSVSLSNAEYPGTIHPQGWKHLRAFSAEPFPRWAYQGEGWTIEKSVQMVRGRNAVVVTYTLLCAPAPVRLRVLPLFALRPIHELMYQWQGRLEAEIARQDPELVRIAPTSRTPEAFFSHTGSFEPAPCWYLATIYRQETARGYAGLEDLWNPGSVLFELQPGQSATFVCSTEPFTCDEASEVLDAERLRAPHPAVADAGNPHLAALLGAVQLHLPARLPGGDLAFPPVTAYPWAEPNLRDALIGFPGLYLVGGWFDEGFDFLKSLASAVRDGLVPTIYPEDGSDPEYSGADTALWFVHAVAEALRWSGDSIASHRKLLDASLQIIESYRAGTGLGLRVDAEGLVLSVVPNRATSWMNAQLGDWVITPRQGRTVELNALWYNALRVVEDWCRTLGDSATAGDLDRAASMTRSAFNRRFWSDLLGCCIDVVGDHGVDHSVRPNQLLAVSLPHAVLSPERWRSVLEVVRARLLTPVGPRTLAPDDPSYQRRYTGDVVSRDRALHQGSVAPWLLGAFVTATARVQGRSEATRRMVRQLLDGCLRHLHSDGLGLLPELFDPEPPFAPGGAPSSLRTTGEILRAYAQEVCQLGPKPVPEPSKPPEPRGMVKP